ncbi:dTDP-4-dehydrorhamnose reductase [Prochlorococcus marinus]|uniref:dTDP-4-dehydrorhamnose reductase n=1 Tax=Prochlorococcus TaxID=1218 RepID=UPI0007B31C8C|nr:dTDP-4-dehydrorhamnose reductase [Prochlorococcus marinus]KZR78351.1 dTDP-4-dehydrorhamnose reductase [Prochlorococcus marinus str. MIT 1323]
MRVLITGGSGQLGQALQKLAPPSVELIVLDRYALDLSDPKACEAAVHELKPVWVINAGAYTAVDRAESESELVYAVNAKAPEALARALQRTGGFLLQLSTDFVFDGAQGSPYQPHQPLIPLGVYGASKAAGEVQAASALDPDRLCILRTSWVYGPVGRNFLLTMLRLHQERETLGVVADQVGCPTSTHGLAQACWSVLEQSLVGRHHWSDAGVASWYDFAVAIGELAMQCELLQTPALVRPLTTADYPTSARRPSYSLLDCTATRSALGLSGIHWRQALYGVLEQLRQI